MKQNVPFGEAHSRQSESLEQKKQSFYQRKSVFPIYNASSAEKRVQKAKVPITKHVV